MSKTLLICGVLNDQIHNCVSKPSGEEHMALFLAMPVSVDVFVRLGDFKCPCGHGQEVVSANPEVIRVVERRMAAT